MENEIDRWYKRLWETKGSRFNAAKRLELHDKWSTLTVSIISVYIISLNLMVLIPERSEILSEENIAFSTVCFSILVLVVSTILASRSYKLRASKFHDCGREINEIYDELCVWKSTNIKPNKDDLLHIGKKYYSILDKFENHGRIDYLTFQADNLKEYKNSIKRPRVFYIMVKGEFYFNTILQYWIFILLPLPLLILFL